MSNLDKLREAMKKAKENKGIQDGLFFEFENVDPTSWTDFLQKTDIGNVISQNERMNFEDSYEKKVRGAFIKLDDESFAKIRLTGNQRSTNCGVSIEFIPSQYLRNAIRYELLDLKELEEYLNETLKLEKFDSEKAPCEGKTEESEENAKNLIDELGIPQNEEEMKRILEEGKLTRDSCLLTYASMLCEQTPQGNEYVDELITLSMQNSKPEHIDRLINDYLTMIPGIYDNAAIRHNRNPNINGIAWARFAGEKVTKGQIPLNYERRKRVLLLMYKGLIRNPNIDRRQIQSLTSTVTMEDDKEAQKFINTLYYELENALERGECKLSRQELTKEAPDYLKRRFRINPNNVFECAVEGTSTDKTIEARTTENPENIKGGEIKR